MFELLLGAIASLGTAEAQNILTSAGENALKNYKEAHAWKKLIVGTGDFFIKNEQDESAFFDDLALVLSKENMSKVANDLKTEDGYDLKNKIYKALMQLMSKYEIPYEIAESYTIRIIYAVLEQLRTISPQKYEHYFLQEWRDEQEKNYSELQKRIDKMSSDLTIYNREQVAIVSSGKLDVDLRRSTFSPSIGIDFFIIDDEHFQDEFEDLRYNELLFIRGRNREETIFCVLNELWRLNDKRPIYVVKSLESWNKLQSLESEGNVYIPWFYADEIVAIEKNTNIFVIDENAPAFGKSVLELRPRTRDTLSKCLQNAGMEYSNAYSLISDTHGLYSQIKKKIFRGEYLKLPDWTHGISERAKKTCLLIGSWEEIDGDKMIVEALYGGAYDDFVEEILPYTKGEDPFLHVIRRNGSVIYSLASSENIWSYMDVLIGEKIWENFISEVLEVINESENLFTYDNRERVIAHFNGERLFWSETIRKGMLNSLLIKGAYHSDTETQLYLDKVVEVILNCVKTDAQWIYISKFWKDLCEISPTSIQKRIDVEMNENTGLLALFENQSSDFLFGRNSYIDILWGVEQFLSQREYFWNAFRWLLKLDNKSYEYKTNAPKDVFLKVFCTWMNFSAIQTAEEKIKAAEIAFEIDHRNAWEHIYSALDQNGRSIFGELSKPRYREHCTTTSTTIADMRRTGLGYFNLLIKHMDFSVDRWKKMILLSDNLSEELRRELFAKLLYELDQMTDIEVMQIKNEIRHFIFRYRYYASADWSLSETIVVEYINLIENIHISTPEYEYVYLFLNDYEYPLLNPVPYDQDGKRNENEEAKKLLICQKITEFKERGYDLKVLSEICAKQTYSTLGRYLARYWDAGKWDYSVFKCLLFTQEEGLIALDYLESFNFAESRQYQEIINDLSTMGCSTGVLAKVYRIEAFRAKNVPLVENASEEIKRAFWKNCIHCESCNEFWVLTECKKYASLTVYLDQIHRMHYNKPLPADVILECFDGIENLPRSDVDQMTSYHLEELLKVIQDAYMYDVDKSIRISHIELLFMNMLKWENMKCFKHMIKKSPELFAGLVDGVFKKDYGSNDDSHKDQTYIHNMYTIYDQAHFCPAENNGEVDEYQLEHWVEKYKELLIENNQESLFTATLGRLFSFSPIGSDGREPCEAVRKMIEKYGDDKMTSRYQTAVYNRRGVFSPSAGRSELKMAEEFKSTGQYLEPDYPKTAQIFFGLYETYKRESDRERMDAENGWY